VLDGSEGGPPRPGRKELKRQLLDRLGRLIKLGVEGGELDPASADVHPALLMGMAHGAIAHAILDASAAPLGVDARVSACVRLFLDGARRP
jgi:hypothetical protein